MTTHKLICLFMVAFALLEAAPAHGLGIRRSPNDHYADEYSKNFEVDFERPGSHSVLKRYCGFLDLGGHCDAMHGAELLDQILHLSRPGGPGKRRKRTAERRPLPQSRQFRRLSRSGQERQSAAGGVASAAASSASLLLTMSSRQRCPHAVLEALRNLTERSNGRGRQRERHDLRTDQLDRPAPPAGCAAGTSADASAQLLPPEADIVSGLTARPAGRRSLQWRWRQRTKPQADDATERHDGSPTRRCFRGELIRS
uniref:Uncharacterized protein n=1 Tax=Macrostomum lignano TaxID=282301 RepID=A0A1I8FBD4_9PLAT